MSVQLSWILEDRVLLQVNQAEVSPQQHYDADQNIVTYFDHSPALLVHIIIDSTRVTKNPSIKVLQSLRFPKHPKCGWVILVGTANTFVRFINAATASFFKSRFRMFETCEQALDFLNDVDSTLPALRPYADTQVG